MPNSTNQRSVGRFRLAAESDVDSRSLGVRLRRALLDEVSGMAAVAVRIEGAKHEFQALPGIREDALAVVQAVKRIRVRTSADTVIATLDSTGPEAKAGDLKLDSGQVVDPDLVIAHISPGSRLKLEVVFRGFSPETHELDGYIPIPADFSPVRSVAVDAQSDHLDITVETDGSATPAEALQSAMEIVSEVRPFEELAIEPAKPVPDVDLGPEFHHDPFHGAEPSAGLAVARESFDDFLTNGIPKLLGLLFPISTAGITSDEPGEPKLDIIDHRIEMPAKTSAQCMAEGDTYQARLILRTRLSMNEDQFDWAWHRRPKIQEREIDMGPIPLMTEQGDFIVNGARRACVMLTDGGHRIDRVGDLFLRELEALVLRMKPILRDMLAATGGERADIQRMVPISDTLNDLLTSTGWGQYLDETNPAASLTHKTRVVARKIDYDAVDKTRMLSQQDFGRLSYLETPEGPNIGFVHSLCLYSQVDPDGNILTPYRDARSGELVWLKAGEEANYKIADCAPSAPSPPVGRERVGVRGGDVLVRDGDDIRRVPASEVDLISISPVQALSPSSSMIPFLGHDDPTRALMGSNMLRQAVSLIRSEQPLVKTGTEAWAARSTGELITARRAGTVLEATSERVVVLADGGKDVYPLTSFRRTNQASCYNHTPLVEPGQTVTEGQVLADVTGTLGGEFALGRNVLVAYMPFRGWNFEDGICVSDELVRADTFTSISIEAFYVDVGTAEIWTPPVGTRVKRGDVLVQESSGTKRVLMLVERYNPCVVVSVRRNGSHVRVLLGERRHAKPGDKFAGRHGNKGVIVKVLPRSQMPYLEDGTPVQMIINTLGVVSRLDLGQILETHYGMLAHTLGTQLTIPPFTTPSDDVLKSKLKEAGLPETGMFTLYDGATGRPFESPVTVGYLHMMKLAHMVDDKIHAIPTGAPSVVTRRPITRYMGQRLGELEIWALEAYRAACTLQESLTIKSDDSEGRERALLALLAGEEIEPAGEGRSLQLLENALTGLCISVEEERR